MASIEDTTRGASGFQLALSILDMSMLGLAHTCTLCTSAAFVTRPPPGDFRDPVGMSGSAAPEPGPLENEAGAGILG